MVLVSSMLVHPQQHQMEANQMRGFSSTAGGASSRGSLGEIEEEPASPGVVDASSDITKRLSSMEMEGIEEKIFVAVGREFKENKSTLVWALQNSPRDKKMVLVHVHRPSQTIPMMGGKFPASQLTHQQVKAHRLLERERMNKTLEEYLLICASMKVQAEKLVIEMDDVAKGLIELIAKHGITKLVMGAAAERHYSKKMKGPRSKTASTVQKEALQSCNIWFVCKGNLICTREPSLDGGGILQSPMANPSSRSTQSEPLKKSLSQGTRLTNPVQEIFRRRARSDNYDSAGREITVAFSKEEPIRMTPCSRLSTEASTIDVWEGISMSSHSSDHSSWSASDEISNLGSVSIPKDEESEDVSVMLPSVHESEKKIQFSSSHDEQEDGRVEYDIYDRLRRALTEAEHSKHEAYEESCRRQKAERDAVEIILKAKTAENLCVKEMKQRKEMEETLAREKLEFEKLKCQQDNVIEELRKAHEQKSALEIQIIESDCVVKDLEDKLSAAQFLLNSLQREREELLRERDDANREAVELQRRKEEASMSTHRAPGFSEFSYLELEQATHKFDNSLKIGEGGYGCVYKGFLRHTSVAIKMLHPQSMQGQNEFHQEVDVLSRVRHPNLVTLIGACSEAWSLIYEFLPNGSLEDRLVCKDNSPPLPWQARTCIAAEICSALIFLHSNKPHSVVHGDLKPANILLDANFVSKLSDFGISRLLIQSNTTTTLYHCTNPKGTFTYMDPEFLATGELNPSSDIYSFGIIILRLLTGRPALGIVKEVREALESGNLHMILDVSAGDWPFVQAQQLAHLGLRCCEMSRKSRPDLVKEVWRVLEPMKKVSSLAPSSSFGSAAENFHIPSYFICPIFQEIMTDPHVAADGFTYEGEALKGWLEGGHDTSPMTNLKLPNNQLIPNHTLRSAIQEWLQQQQS